jgi:hypothetical protein
LYWAKARRAAPAAGAGKGALHFLSWPNPLVVLPAVLVLDDHPPARRLLVSSTSAGRTCRILDRFTFRFCFWAICRVMGSRLFRRSCSRAGGCRCPRRRSSLPRRDADLAHLDAHAALARS